MYLKSIKVLEKVQMQRSIVNSLYTVDFRVASHADALSGLCHAFLFLKEALTTSALETNSRSAINPDSGFREIFTPWNPESCALESRIRVLLTKTGIQYLEPGTHGMESRTQDCLLGFHYMGRSRAVEHNNTHAMKS